MHAFGVWAPNATTTKISLSWSVISVGGPPQTKRGGSMTKQAPHKLRGLGDPMAPIKIKKGIGILPRP